MLLGVGGGSLSLAALGFVIEYAPGLATLTLPVVLGLMFEGDLRQNRR